MKNEKNYKQLIEEITTFINKTNYNILELTTIKNMVEKEIDNYYIQCRNYKKKKKERIKKGLVNSLLVLICTILFGTAMTIAGKNVDLIKLLFLYIPITGACIIAPIITNTNDNSKKIEQANELFCNKARLNEITTHINEYQQQIIKAKTILEEIMATHNTNVTYLPTSMMRNQRPNLHKDDKNTNKIIPIKTLKKK
ncbi:MAG: hypothetical protein Q4G04_04345 [bacterium]|nr:hypothetical protein [bacterium]